MAAMKTTKQAGVTVQLRMSRVEKVKFSAHAKSLGLSLSAWLRMVAHNALKREAKS